MNLAIWDKTKHSTSGLGMNLVVGEYIFTFNFPVIEAQNLIDNVLPQLPKLLYTDSNKQFTLVKYSVDVDNPHILHIHLKLHENPVGCIAIASAICAILVLGIVFLTKVERVVTVAPLILPIVAFAGYKLL